jgi:uncharacterized protein (TIGR02996 family)
MAKKGAKRRSERALTADDEAFYRAVLADPESDAPRLAYADWLEEQGDLDRAEFIRTQLELFVTGTRWLHHRPHWKRYLKLLEKYTAEWRERLPQMWRDYLGLERGFPGMLTCQYCEFTSVDESLWQAAPVTTLSMQDHRALTGDYESTEEMNRCQTYHSRRIAAAPYLAHIRHLDLAESGLRVKDLKLLLASPHLTNLLSLTLAYNGFGDAGARVVAESPNLPRLTSLSMYSDQVGDKGAIALAQAPHLAHLTVLDLQSNQVGPKGAEALAASPHLANLERLDLRSNPVAAAQGVLRETFGDRVLL